MMFKTTLFVCGLVLSIQNVHSQVLGLGNIYGPSYGANPFSLSGVDVSTVSLETTGLGTGLGASGLGAAGFGGVGLGGLSGLPSNVLVESPAFINLNGLAAGGVLPMSSIGPIVPAGLNVVSDNVIEGAVALNGQLPFLSAVAFEGAMPSAGSGISQCGCGSGNVGIISETARPVVNAGAAGVNNLGLGGLGLGGYSGFGGLGVGGGLGLVL